VLFVYTCDQSHSCNINKTVPTTSSISFLQHQQNYSCNINKIVPATLTKLFMQHVWAPCNHKKRMMTLNKLQLRLGGLWLGGNATGCIAYGERAFNNPHNSKMFDLGSVRLVLVRRSSGETCGWWPSPTSKITQVPRVSRISNGMGRSSWLENPRPVTLMAYEWP